MAAIALEGVAKQFANGAWAVRRLDLEVDDGELVVLVGPSGSGKTTVLRIVAGLEEATEGIVRLGGRPVDHLGPHQRDVAMVFQSYALYPHMSVFDNLAFPLRMRGVERGERRRRVEEAAALLGLSELLDRRPAALSGGQRQRVAMGRAVVREPAAFLMDEPLSNLDAKLRAQMRAELARLHHRLATTTLYVTHDQTEAMTLADRVAVLSDGELQQFDPPGTVYDRPANVFVAGFIGSPPMNLLPGVLDVVGDRLAVRLGHQRLVVPETVLTRRIGEAPLPGASRKERLRAEPGRPVLVGVRPEDLADPAFAHRRFLGQGDVASEQVLEVTIGLVEHLGPEALAYFRPGGEGYSGPTSGRPSPPSEGEPSGFCARLPARTELRGGQPAKLVVDVERLHL
ncbi:MAG: ABC transporter ATP-binding protein, partial [Acidimicrobiia bacterium]